MIVILSGITGVGKSYIKKHIIEKLNFKNIVIVTTRAKRKNEVPGIDKHFVTEEQYELLKQENKTSVNFEFLENKYAYYTEDLISEENSITELHYDTIKEFKKVAKNVVSIYIKPKKIKLAIEQLKLRKLPSDVENSRIKEIKQQILEFEKNKELKEMFDYIIYNDYTEKTIEYVINLLKGLIEKKQSLCLKEG